MSLRVSFIHLRIDNLFGLDNLLVLDIGIDMLAFSFRMILERGTTA
jgi:hypothetical protein